MKKTTLTALFLAALMFFLPAFAQEEEEAELIPPIYAGNSPVEIDVSVPFEGSELELFEGAVAEWEGMTGNSVAVNYYEPDNEGYEGVKRAFSDGNGPQVFFFPTDGPADSLVNGGTVMPIAEIREYYSSYASNMQDGFLPKSTLDQQNYAVPLYGSYVILFYNPAMLEGAGVAQPGDKYTWEQFLDDCQKIADAGYIPLAASLEYLPHYWFEYTVMNHGTAGNQTDIPESTRDKTGRKWLDGMNDIKELYSRGYFPEGQDLSEAYADSLFYNGDAAFMLGHSRKIDQFAELAPDNINDFAAGYVPAQGDRTANSIISGITNGYYISRAAFDDDERRDASISLVEYLTRDDIVKAMSGTNLTALKNSAFDMPANSSNLARTAATAIQNAGAASQSVMDFVSDEAKGAILSNIEGIANGQTDPGEVLASFITINERYPR